jgi:hypothetical protein
MTTAANDVLLQANPCNLTGKVVVVPNPKQRNVLLPEHTLVRRTWAVWPSNSRRRDVGHLIAAFEPSGS